MGRAGRLVGGGVTYHVTARGNGKVGIFGDDADRVGFLRLIRSVGHQRAWKIWAYCLMGNHVHLCVTTPEPNLSEGMRDLLGRYARGFNRRYGFVDHLFGRRFGSSVIHDDGHLITVIRYVARNPERAGLVDDPADWRWSSYAELVGPPGHPVIPIVCRADVLGLFHRRETHAIGQLRQLVAADPPPSSTSLQTGTRPSPRSLSQVLPVDRAIEIALAMNLTVPQIAAALDLPYVTVWRAHAQIGKGIQPPVS